MRLPWGTDEVLSYWQPGTKTRWAWADRQGTVRDVVEINGTTVAVVEHQNHNSFGQITSDTNPSYEFRFGYTGRLWDSAIDLQFNRARWYDPALGKFLSEDPLGFAAGDANLTRYVGGDPVNFTDPSGLEEENPLLMDGLPGLDDPIIVEEESSPQFQGPTPAGAHQPGGFAVVEKLVNKGINWLIDKWFGGGKSKSQQQPAGASNGTVIDGSDSPQIDAELISHADTSPLAVWQADDVFAMSPNLWGSPQPSLYSELAHKLARQEYVNWKLRRTELQDALGQSGERVKQLTREFDLSDQTRLCPKTLKRVRIVGTA